MLKDKVKILMSNYGVKQEAIIEQLNTNRVTFTKKKKDNSFDESDRVLLYQKWGKLL